MKRDINKRDVVGATQLFEAVSANDVAKVEKLLAAGADPNIPENNGTTPLMEAAGAASAELIKLLICHGASIDCVDNFGDSAADYARNRVGKPGVELLRELTSSEMALTSDERTSASQTKRAKPDSKTKRKGRAR